MRRLQDPSAARSCVLSDSVRLLPVYEALGAWRVSARRAVQSGSRSGMAVPAEISGGRVDAIWSSVAETRQWYADHGLVWPEGRATHVEAPGRRRDRAARAWALANGLGSARFPTFLDHAGCRQAGVTFAGCKGVREPN